MSGLVHLLFNAASAAATVSRGLRPRLQPSARIANAMASLGGPEITVLGGGFGGLYTALRLSSLDWAGGPRPHVTLVDRSDRFCFSPMLYQLTTGTASAWEVAPRYEDLLAGTQIEFVRGEVSGIDEEESIVRIVAAPTGSNESAERLLPYDQCVLALGVCPQTEVVPGVTEHALTYQTVDDALELKRRLAEMRRAADGSALRISVVGGGYVGVELAANIARSLPAGEASISLIHRSGSLLPNAAEFSRNEAQRQLTDAGVDVMLDTAVSSVSPGALSLLPQRGPPQQQVPTAQGDSSAGSRRASASEYELPADLVVWTAGTRPAEVVSKLGLPFDASGRIDAEPTLRVSGRSNLYALGDAARVSARSGPVPPTAQAAMQQADYAAWNIRAAVREQPALAFRYTVRQRGFSYAPASLTPHSLQPIPPSRAPARLAMRCTGRVRRPFTPCAPCPHVPRPTRPGEIISLGRPQPRPRPQAPPTALRRPWGRCSPLARMPRALPPSAKSFSSTAASPLPPAASSTPHACPRRSRRPRWGSLGWWIWPLVR